MEDKLTSTRHRLHLMVCAGTACVSNRSFEIKEALEREIKKQGLAEEVLVVTTGCNGSVSYTHLRAHET